MAYTKEEYYQYLQTILPESDFTLTTFNGTELPCKITCNICGTTHDFSQAALITRRARRNCKNVCKNCEHNDWTQRQKAAENKAKFLLEQKKTIELVDGLKSWGSKEVAIWKCLKCNHTFERAPSIMFTQNSLFCPWCETHPFVYTEEMIKEKTYELWGTEYTLLNISSLQNKNGSKRIIVCHNNCGFKYSVSLWNFLHGQGCPKCKSSHGEVKVRKYLNEHNFKFQEQYSIFIDNTYLRFDFYLEENNQKFAIEYNGIQHYQPVHYFGGIEGFQKQQKRDELKNQYCCSHKINLIVIPYNDESLINSEKLAQRLRGQAAE